MFENLVIDIALLQHFCVSFMSLFMRGMIFQCSSVDGFIPSLANLPTCVPLHMSKIGWDCYWCSNHICREYISLFFSTGAYEICSKEWRKLKTENARKSSCNRFDRKISYTYFSLVSSRHFRLNWFTIQQRMYFRLGFIISAIHTCFQRICLVFECIETIPQKQADIFWSSLDFIRCPSFIHLFLILKVQYRVLILMNFVHWFCNCCLQ